MWWCPDSLLPKWGVYTHHLSQAPIEEHTITSSVSQASIRSLLSPCLCLSYLPARWPCTPVFYLRYEWVPKLQILEIHASTDSLGENLAALLCPEIGLEFCASEWGSSMAPPGPSPMERSCPPLPHELQAGELPLSMQPRGSSHHALYSQVSTFLAHQSTALNF